MKFLVQIILLTLCWLPGVQGATQHIDSNKWQFSLSAGQGLLTTPLAGRADLKGNLLPTVSYYGERFYLENSYVGYSLLEQENWYIDLVGSLNEDGMFFELDGTNKFGWWDALGFHRTSFIGDQPGLEVQPSRGSFGTFPANDEPIASNSYQDIKRNLSYMGGISLNWLTNFFDIRLSALKDVSGVHHGQEHHLTIRKNYQFEQWSWQFRAGLTYKDQKLNNYYYNLRPEEVNQMQPQFKLSGTWHYFYGITLSYQLTPEWALLAYWQRNVLDDALLQSRLLARDSYYGRFVGVRYSF
ncbi:MipA/OmpV family protein [Rheinheimera mangrovi]|uniref:MipA/OmpV family protein n=1 Tax=Rheinheimera mangrovi TaxID=2498451 RepID=UPI000F8E03A7|nr:MipA/OmpV family protein [Rheinheimera mangrovi]